MINKLFSLLDEWRLLPAYQLERRVDIFFALYLPEIIQRRFKTDIDRIIPEFPIYKGQIENNGNEKHKNFSFKIDYIAISEKSNIVYFIELKTDDRSRNKRQDKNLENAKVCGIYNLVDAIIGIREKTSSKKKYQNLLSLLAKAGWVNKKSQENTSHNYNIEIVYIQPNNLAKGDETIISFSEIIDFLTSYDDALTKRFIESLEKWKTNPNI